MSGDMYGDGSWAPRPRCANCGDFLGPNVFTVNDLRDGFIVALDYCSKSCLIEDNKELDVPTPDYPGTE